MDRIAEQCGCALLYYAALVTMMRLAGKRFAGQTTTFDLLVLISLSVVLQQSMLREGRLNAAVFVVTVFAAHRLLAAACGRWAGLRRLIRGGPKPLVKDGRVLAAALAQEGMTTDELLAGLRKLGFEGPDAVKLAVLEETGHISAVGFS